MVVSVIHVGILPFRWRVSQENAIIQIADSQVIHIIIKPLQIDKTNLNNYGRSERGRE